MGAVGHAGNCCNSDAPLEIAVGDVCRPACQDNADPPVEIPTALESAVDDLSHEGATGCKGNGYLRHICKELASTEIELAGCY